MGLNRPGDEPPWVPLDDAGEPMIVSNLVPREELEALPTWPPVMLSPALRLAGAESRFLAESLSPWNDGVGERIPLIIFAMASTGPRDDALGGLSGKNTAWSSAIHVPG